MGITVSGKVGNAVVRNYVKRSVREWFRGVRNTLGVCDVVVIARRDAAKLRGPEFAAALNGLIMDSGAQGR